MDSRNNSNNERSPKLKAAITEPILLPCIKGIPICELSCEIQRMTPLPYKAPKKYLFYLINYELLSYDGQGQVYITEDEGFNLLYVINKEKKMTMVNGEDIVIIIE